jgi:hypothetical protein
MSASARLRLCRLVAALACTCPIPAIALAQSPGPHVAGVAVQMPRLLNREALDAYLLANAGKPTPLDALPPLARQRFLDSLVFGRGGVGGFDTSDLAAELTPVEIVRVLALFDAQDHAGAVQSRHTERSLAWRRQAEHPGEIERGFDMLYQLQRTGATEALRTAFRANVAPKPSEPDAIAALSEREQVYLLRSIELVAADSPTPADIGLLREVVTGLQARGIAKPQDHRAVYDGMLLLRQFDAARQYASVHPDARLPQLPRMTDPYGNQAPAFTVWRASADAGTLTRTPLNLGPAQILVTAGCHFSQDAAEDIREDPLLGPAFAQHAHWLMLPPGQEDLADVRDWNQRFPEAQAQLVHTRDEWTLLPPRWSMPEFFIVRDGKVVERIAGWPRGDATHRQKLIEALERTGLLDAGQGASESPAQGDASSNR